jgi:hypothetical protein
MPRSSLDSFDVGTNRLVIDQFMSESRMPQQCVVEDISSSYHVLLDDENDMSNCTTGSTAVVDLIAPIADSGSSIPKSSAVNPNALYDNFHSSSSDIISPTLSETSFVTDRSDAAFRLSSDADVTYIDSGPNSGLSEPLSAVASVLNNVHDSNDESALLKTPSVGLNGFVSMREQDAELLESIQLLSNDSITTPCLTAAALPTSFGSGIDSEIPPLSLADGYAECPQSSTQETVGTIQASTIASQLFRNYQTSIPYIISDKSNSTGSTANLPAKASRHHRSRTGVTPGTSKQLLEKTLQESFVNSINTFISSASSSNDTKNTSPNGLYKQRSGQSPTRRALSGEVWTSSHFNSNEITERDCTKSDAQVSLFKDSVVTFDEELTKSVSDVPEQNRRSCTVATIRRSDSSERRLNETAQFAEAVGETMLLEDTTIQIIDDDDVPDYHDDDEEEELLLSEIPKSSQHSIVSLTAMVKSQCDVDIDFNPNPLSLSVELIAKQRQQSEAALFASAVGDFELDFTGDQCSAILIVDDDDLNDQHLDDDDDEDQGLDIKILDKSSSQAQDDNNGKQQILGVPTSTVAFLTVDRSDDSPNKMHDADRAMSKHQRSFSNQPSSLPMTMNRSESSDKVNSMGVPVETIRRNRSTGFLDKLPDDYNSAPETAKQLDFVYKGIQSNPPEIVKRGITRGNYAQLHRKAWLEVSDKYHRYGKNLRLYYRYWESLGFPTNMFFDWLDSKGEAAGQALPELEECPRTKLDADTVLYITNPKITESYLVHFVPTTSKSVTNNFQNNGASPITTNKDVTESAVQMQSKTTMRPGLVFDVNDNPVCTGPDGWIFVLRDNKMYGAPKVTSVGTPAVLQQQQHGTIRQQRFHHSSFFGGKAVAAAGIFITDESGMLTRIYPHSGHYRPGEAHMQRVLFFLYHQGIDLRTFEMDIQQILHVARGAEGGAVGNDVKPALDEGHQRSKSNLNSEVGDKIIPKAEKKKKLESLHLLPAILVACFLAHKARFIGEGIFAQIHKIRKRGPDITTVTEALNIIDEGGCFWSSNTGALNQHASTSFRVAAS